MMRVSTFPIEDRWLRDYAPSEVDALPDANIALPECRVDPSATIDGWIRGVRDVEDAFVRLASPFQLALQRLERERPHVMEQSFDLVSQGGRLRVVDTDLDQADRDWIETELNRDGGLAGLANAFNRQVVRSYETDHGTRNENGDLLARTGFLADGGAAIDYAGLHESVDESVKFRSLLRDVNDAQLPWWMKESSRYQLGGRLVQSYIVGEITQYVVRPDGSGEVQTTRGSILREDLWA